MAKKKVKGDAIYFTGKASEEVTGSQYLIRFGDYQILLECGLHQSSSNSYLDSYRINSEKFKFKPAEIDYVFVCHPHIDHCGLIPRLVNEGFHGQIIATSVTAAVMKSLLLNSSYIVHEEARTLSRCYHREYKPLYEEDDVYDAMKLVHTYDEYNEIIKLNDTISFRWFKNSHCIGAAQLQLILTNGNKTKRVLYTSDIGALKSTNHFVEDTEIPRMFNDVVLMESTYGNSKREVKRTRKADLEHLRVSVLTTLERGGTVIMPAFSFSRTQELLSNLYDTFGNDDNFNYRIIVDSMLSCELCDLYGQLLTDQDSEYWEKVCSWDKVQFVKDKDVSRSIVYDNTPKIVISSSGFCTNGRVVSYLQEYLQDRNSTILFSGYTGDNPSYLSYRIKNYREHKHISINKKKIDNLADCASLTTFSSHAPYSDLIKYGSSLETNKLVLVHGTDDGKKCLINGLEKAISKNDKTYKVIAATKNMIVHLR